MTFKKKMPTMNGIGGDKEEQEQSKLEEVKDEAEKEVQGDEGKAKSGQEQEAIKDKSEGLVAKIEELQKHNAELERKLIYIASEYENSKKRNAKELDDARKFAIGKFAKAVVDLFDVLQKAMESADENNTDKILFEGVKMTINEFERVFENMQIKKIEPEVGSVFNHNQQEAISRVPSELEAGSIVQVIRCGYELYDRLLRPAMVVVSGGK